MKIYFDDPSTASEGAGEHCEAGRRNILKDVSMTRSHPGWMRL